jgi:ubiquinone/menaquinone biosynthesis C-methylase UbiE
MSLEDMRLWDSRYDEEERFESYLPIYGLAFYKKLGNLEGNVLDVGCSDLGCFSDQQKASAKNLIGLDISKFVLDRAKRRNKKLQNIDLAQGRAQNIPFTDNSFDNVICIETIKHTNNSYKEVLEELKRVLKKEGRMTLTFQHKNYAEKSGFEIKSNLAFNLETLTSVSVFDEQDVKKLIEGRGLVIKEMTTYTTKDLDDKGFPPETKDIIYVECKKV